ncbi:putative high-affinity branched-chain amino acid transport system permease protein [Mesorhizobium plurifarium]|uniref:Putative high-affinity branched-chain amino acid transport system permease protein n=1 Tax=Mesorhizobium plurifarium TaxID=69974 RepID=A0A090G8L1_MESPL|nr:putative high-affinity branched-chain amino acid transport system permease protein [Mesorhizobium plurifarium]CDX54729.1 putative high-affinity branched-chain amino acid transport system permease protein [Mesorhizobium plurifarium]
MQATIALLLDTANFTLALLLVTLGLVVIFGLMNVINMAHGEFFLIGAYVVVAVSNATGSFWLGLLLAPLVLAVVGLLVEWLIIRHIYHRFIDTILATWGLSLVIKQGVVVLFGPGAQSVPNPLPTAVDVFGVQYPAYRLFIMALAAALALATYYLFFRTKLGLQIRGVIANRAMAASLGINTRRMDRATFAVGSALAGFAGAVMAPIMSVDPQMGVGFLIPSFLSVLVGGVNSLVGALIGSGVIGGATTIFSAGISQADAQILVFLLAMIIIRFLPSGIIGGRK